jgi:hypothetical protein
MPRHTVAIFVLSVLMLTTSALAEDSESPKPLAALTAADAAEVDWSLPTVHFGQAEATRGRLLPGLYVGLAALNAYDAYSTAQGINRGATEANPLMRGVVGSQAAMWAVKGGVTASTIVLAEKLWRKNRRMQAIAVMAIANGMMAAVAARNGSVLRRQR